MFQGTYEHPFIPNAYPKTLFSQGAKNEPGLQICDFLLWATLRKMLEDDEHSTKESWYKRVIKPLKISSVILMDGTNQFDIPFGFEPKKITNPCYYSVSDCLTEDEFWRLSPTELFELYIEAETFITETNFPKRLSHLNSDVQILLSRRGTIQKVEDIDFCARLYLKIFDTLPVITDVTLPEEKTHLLNIKRFMGFLVRKDQCNSVLCCLDLVRYVNKTRSL